MNKLYVLVGLPASGKSFFAAEMESLGVCRVSIDEYASKLKSISKEIKDYEIDEMALKVVNEKLKGNDVVYDCCSNTNEYRAYIEEEVKTKHETIYVIVYTPIEECRNRVQKRNEEGEHFYSLESFNKRVKEFTLPEKKENVIVISTKKERLDFIRDYLEEKKWLERAW